MQTLERYRLRQLEELFFYYIEERYKISQLKKDNKYPYTDDLALMKYHFSNIHRNEDPTTKLIKNVVRNQCKTLEKKIYAIILCRLFNSVSMIQDMIDMGLMKSWSERTLKKVINHRLFNNQNIFSQRYSLSFDQEDFDNQISVKTVFEYLRETIDTIGKNVKEYFSTANIRKVEDCHLFFSNLQFGVGNISYEMANDFQYISDKQNGFEDQYTYYFLSGSARRGTYRLMGIEFVYCRQAKDGLNVVIDWNNKEKLWMKNLLNKVNQHPQLKDIPTINMVDLVHTLSNFNEYCSVVNRERKGKKIYHEYKQFETKYTPLYQSIDFHCQNF